MGCAMQVQCRKVLERGAAGFADESPSLIVDNAVFAHPCAKRRRVGAQRAAEHDFIVLLQKLHYNRRRLPIGRARMLAVPCCTLCLLLF